MIARAIAIVGALSVSVDATPGSSIGVYAPKGFPGAVAHHDATFLYATYIQDASLASAGAGATMLQGDPGLADADSHTLAEIGVSSSDGRQIVEIGWHIDPLVHHDVQPRLFVFHWVDGVPTCYNGCGFVQVSTTRSPGMHVTPGEIADYAIKLRGPDWWLYYQGDPLGYFPGSLWPTGYSAAGHVQWFGEVAAGSTEPCTEMGNGERGASPLAATMTNLVLFNTAGTAIAADARPGVITAPALYSVGQMTSTSFGFGGPGAPFGCCTPMSCFAASASCGAVPDACGSPLRCGSCPEATDACRPDFTCGPAPAGSDMTFDDDTGGCCRIAGGGLPSAIVLGAIVSIVLRRRGRRGRQ